MSGTSSDDKGCTKEKFDRLLSWLNPDREEATQQYSKIYFKLSIQFERNFSYDGFPCVDAEMLTDKTITIICCKMPELADGYEGEPIAYFRGVAKKVYQEYKKKYKKHEPLSDVDPPAPDPDPDPEPRHKCLEDCLKQLSKKDRDLILKYFQDDKKAKIDHRRELAEELKIPLNTLRTRIYRIKEELGKCIADCLEKIKRRKD